MFVYWLQRRYYICFCFYLETERLSFSLYGLFNSTVMAKAKI